MDSAWLIVDSSICDADRLRVLKSEAVSSETETSFSKGRHLKHQSLGASYSHDFDSKLLVMWDAASRSGEENQRSSELLAQDQDAHLDETVHFFLQSPFTKGMNF